MTYRLTKGELRIIEQTKREGEAAHNVNGDETRPGAPESRDGSDREATDGTCAPDSTPAGISPTVHYGRIPDRSCEKPTDPADPENLHGDKPPGLMAILKPYLYFTGMILVILVAIAFLLMLSM